MKCHTKLTLILYPRVCASLWVLAFSSTTEFDARRLYLEWKLCRRSDESVIWVGYAEGSVFSLPLDDEDDCTCFDLEDGRTLKVATVLLATGANTAMLSADRTQERQKLQVKDTVLGLAVVFGMVEWNGEQVNCIEAKYNFASSRRYQ